MARKSPLRKNYDAVVGQKFEKLTCIEWYHVWRKDGAHRFIYLKCKCECGNEASIYHPDWGKQKSCGCLKLNQKGIKSPTYKHGVSKKVRLYRTWASMRERVNDVNNKSYKRYGERGIKICEEWGDFLVFQKWALENGYNDTLTIERNDVDKDYCPDNCCWVPMEKQADNTSRTVKWEFNGQIKTARQWCDLYGFVYGTITWRSREYYKKTGERKLVLNDKELDIVSKHLLVSK